MSKQAVRSWLLGIVVLGLAVRLFEIGEPLIDKQAWRQADTAAVARNYFEEGDELLWPRVDWRGATAGYVEMNFPLYPFLVSGLYGVWGEANDSLGRLLSALFSVATSLVLFVFARRLFDDDITALCAAFFFLFFPLNIYFGRVFMPEPLMLLLSVMTLWLFHSWVTSGHLVHAVGAVLSAALCFLVKVPTLYLGFPLLAIAIQRWGWRFVLRPALWCYTVAILAPAVLWYVHAADLFAETGLTFGIWNRYGYDKWDRGVLLTVDFYRQLGWRFFDSIYTPVGCAAVILGLYACFKERRDWVLWGWLGGLLLYVLIVPEGNRKLHYYQLPFVPIGALFAARGVAWLNDRCSENGKNQFNHRRVLFLGIGAVGFLTYGVSALGPYYDQPNNIHAYYESCHRAGQLIDAKLPSDAALVIGDLDENSGAPFRAQSPTMLYYCHRKGWQITPEEFTSARLDSLAAQGADFFMVAGAFAMKDTTFWQDLLRRGVSTPISYPKKWTDETLFRAHVTKERDPSRHFVLVRL